MVKIGGKSYTFKPVPIRKAKELRADLEKQIEPLSSITAGSNATELVNSITGTLVHAPDMMLEWLCKFSPEIKEDLSYIEENGFDHEIVQAFKEALGILYPFGSLLNSLNGLKDHKT